MSTQLSVAPCSHDQAIEANLVVYNTALSACATGMAWQKALQLFEDVSLGSELRDLHAALLYEILLDCVT